MKLRCLAGAVPASPRSPYVGMGKLRHAGRTRWGLAPQAVTEPGSRLCLPCPPRGRAGGTPLRSLDGTGTLLRGTPPSVSPHVLLPGLFGPRLPASISERSLAD